MLKSNTWLRQLVNGQVYVVGVPLLGNDKSDAQEVFASHQKRWAVGRDRQLFDGRDQCVKNPILALHVVIDEYQVSGRQV